MIGGVLAGGGLSMGGSVRPFLIGYGPDLCIYDLHRYAGLRYGPSGFVMASGALGEKGRALHHQHAPCHRLRRLVRHPVRDLRQCLCQYGCEHDGH